MPWRPLPEDRRREMPRPLSASLGRLAARLGAAEPEVLRVVFTRWESVVGRDIAAHARPVELRHRVLIVEVDQPAWITQLRYLRPDLLRSIATATHPDAVTEIHLRVTQPASSRRRR